MNEHIRLVYTLTCLYTVVRIVINTRLKYDNLTRILQKQYWSNYRDNSSPFIQKSLEKLKSLNRCTF